MKKKATQWIIAIATLGTFILGWYTIITPKHQAFPQREVTGEKNASVLDSLTEPSFFRGFLNGAISTTDSGVYPR